MHPYPAEPIRVIHSQGDDKSIGRSHAEQLGDAVGKGMPTFYADFWNRLIQNPPTSDWLKPAARTASWLIDPYLVRKLLKQVPDSFLKRVEGVAEVSGRPLRELTTALVLPDLLPLLQAYLTKLRPANFVPPAPFPCMACSSFLWNGKYFLHGRNLDFPGVAYWDRFPVVQSIRAKSAIPYLAFTTAGVPVGGITGVNQEQISVSLHQHYSRRASLSGKLPFVIAEEILQTARSLDEALEILRNARTATAWAFVLTDGKRRQGAIVECDAETQAVRHLKEGPLTHSNFFQTAGCRAGEYATSARMNWDNQYRARRLMNLLTAAGSDLEPAKAVTFLSDHWDEFWGEEKICNRVVSQTYNIQSLCLDTERMKAWMAEGEAPIHLRQYVELDLGQIFSGSEGKTGVRLPGYQFRDPKKRVAKERFIISFVEAFSGREEEASKNLIQALADDFFPEGAQILAMLSWKKGDFPHARDWLEKSKTWFEGRNPSKFPPEYFEASLFLARTQDLLGKRSQAVRGYQAVAGHKDLEDENLRRLAKREGPFRPAGVRRIVMPYSSYIPFE